MKHKIRIRTLFILPILSLMVLFPIAVYGIFRITASNHMQNLAKSELRSTLDVVLPIAQDILVDVDEGLPAEEARLARKEQVRDFLKLVRAEFKKNTTNTQLVVLDRDFELTYPEEGDLSPGLHEIQGYFQDKLKNDKESVSFDSIDHIVIGDREFLTYAIELKISENSSRFLIAYSRAEDVTELLTVTAQLILYITVALAVMMTAVLIIVSQRISRPIERLCRHTSQINNGSLNEITEQSNVAEIASLTDEMNNMSRRLRQSEEEQRAFYQNVSHELRTPLMSIRGYAEGMAFGAFEDNSEAISIIVAQSLKLTDLAGELLMLSELENKGWGVDITYIPLREYIPGAVRLIEGVAMQKGIAVVERFGQGAAADTDDNKYIVRADEELIDKTIGNLLSNAVRYARTKVTVEVFEEDGVHIRVSDDGPGIDEKDMGSIFKRFYKGKGGNTGLGLSIVKAAVGLMDGSIQAYNSSEGGAVFDVVLRGRA